MLVPMYLVDVARHEGSASGGVQVDLEAERPFLGDGELAALQLRNAWGATRPEINVMSTHTGETRHGDIKHGRGSLGPNTRRSSTLGQVKFVPASMTRPKL